MAPPRAALARPDAARDIAERARSRPRGGARAGELRGLGRPPSHLVGIGGAGHERTTRASPRSSARTVSGSDRAESPALERLRGAGIDARVGHDAANVPPRDDVEVVRSTAIPAGQPRARGGASAA